MNKSKKKKRPAAILPETEQQYTNEQLVQMIQTEGDQHGEKMLRLMQQNQGFITMKAKPFVAAGGVDAEEVQSIAFIAMSDAVRIFRPGEASFLKVFSWYFIRELILTANSNRTVPLPSHMSEKIHRFTKWRARFKAEHRREPTEREAMKALGLSRDQLHSIQSAMNLQFPIRLDEPMPDAEDGTGADDALIDTIPDTCQGVEDCVTDDLSLSELRAAIAEELENLPKAEADAIRMKYFDGSAAEDKEALHRAMRNLCRPERMRRLSEFTSSYYGSGLQSFKVSFTSKPEAIIIKLDEGKR